MIHGHPLSRAYRKLACASGSIVYLAYADDGGSLAPNLRFVIALSPP